MAISADMVKKLREQTGAGMMDCKKALTETNGDYEKAVTLLREKGIAVAAKREAKAASEGMIGFFLADDCQMAALTELNCETTFVAKTDDFIQIAEKSAEQAAKSDAADLAALLNESYIGNPSKTLGTEISEVMGKVGEKMGLARFAKLKVEGNGTIGSYIHMGSQIGVLVQLATDSAEAAASDDVKELSREIAMHISWSNPEYMCREDINADKIDAERDVHRQWAIKEGKPENVIERIVDGRMKEFYSRTCLLEQPFIKDEEQTIQKLIDAAAKKVGRKIEINTFVRFRVGETSGDGE